MYITRGPWATLITREEVTSKKQAWTSFHQNFSWKSYFKMTEVISLLRKKTKSKIESIHSMMFCAKWTYVSATEVNAFLLFSCYYTPKMDKNKTIYLKELESHAPKDMLC